MIHSLWCLSLAAALYKIISADLMTLYQQILSVVTKNKQLVQFGELFSVQLLK